MDASLDWKGKRSQPHEDRLEITWLGIKIEELDAEYRHLQEEIVEAIGEDEEALQKEQEVCDKQAEKVADYQQHLDVLDAAVKLTEEPGIAHKLTAPAMPAVDSSQGLSRRINYIEDALGSVGRSVAPVEAGPELDLCLVQNFEEKVN